jgi:hypothetical protein
VRVGKVQAHQMRQFTSNMLEFLFKLDLTFATTDSSGARVGEVQAHQTRQFNHENIFFLFVENSKKIYILRKSKKYYMGSLIPFIRKVHV